MEQSFSLRETIDASDKITDIRLSLRSEIGCQFVWILVEGENDYKLYQKFIDANKARIEYVGGGKGQLEIALQILTQETNQVIGIRDADFCHLENSYPSVTNLFFTDFHDIEMTMLNSDQVMENLLTEHNLQEYLENIRENILKEASFLGYVRWYNEINNLELLFKGLGLGDFIEMQDSIIKINKENLIAAINQRSSNKRRAIDLPSIIDFQNQKYTNDFYNLCNGHDVTALLSLRIGSSVSKNELSRHIRISYRLIDFNQTSLYRNIYNWQQENGFIFLKSIAA